MNSNQSGFRQTFQTDDFTDKTKRKKEIKVETNAFKDTAAEFEEMRNLLIKSYTFNENFGSWLGSRLEKWRYGHQSLFAATDIDFFKNKAQLWRNVKKELIGFCIQECEDSGIHIQPRPGELFLIPIMVDWIVSHWGKEKTAIETYSIEEDYYSYELLMAAGFKNCGVYESLNEFDTTLKRDQIPLKSGFMVKNLNEHQNAESLLDTLNASLNLDDKADGDWLNTILSVTSMSDNWILSVMNSDGECVSCCFVWIDNVNKIAEINPIATHPDYQQNGFAKQLIIECFRRLQLAGINRCYLLSKSEPVLFKHICEMLQPESVKNYLKWRKNLG